MLPFITICFLGLWFTINMWIQERPAVVGKELPKKYTVSWLWVAYFIWSSHHFAYGWVFSFTSGERCPTAHHFRWLGVGMGPLLFLITLLCVYQEQTLPRLSRQPAMIQSFPERSISLANNQPLALRRCWTAQPITGELRKHDIIVRLVQKNFLGGFSIFFIDSLSPRYLPLSLHPSLSFSILLSLSLSSPLPSYFLLSFPSLSLCSLPGEQASKCTHIHHKSLTTNPKFFKFNLLCSLT